MMISSITKRICGTIFCFFLFLNAASLTASQHVHAIQIQPIAYSFKASYKIHDSSSHSDRTVKLHAMRPINKHRWPTCPGLPMITLRCTINNKHTVTKISPQSKDKYKFLKIPIPISSSWHSVIKKLAKRAAAVYSVADRADLPHTAKKHTQHLSSLRSIQIKALSDCKLDATYTVRIMSFRKHYSRFPKNMVISVAIRAIRDEKGKKMLTARASLYKGLAHKTPLCKAVFIQTKKGMKESTAKSSKHSFTAYPGAKEVIEKSVEKYFRFMRVHKRKFSNQTTAKCVENRGEL